MLACEGRLQHGHDDHEISGDTQGPNAPHGSALALPSCTAAQRNAAERKIFLTCGKGPLRCMSKTCS